MFLRILMHIIFGSLPFIIINYFTPPGTLGIDIAMLNFVAFILAIPCNFLALPFINLVFRYQYKKFWNNYEHRNSLPRYSSKKEFHLSLYEFFKEISSLDGFESYEFTYDDFFNLQVVLIIPLIRMNNKMNIINSVSFNELQKYFNIFPTNLIMNSMSKKNFKELSKKYQDKIDAQYAKDVIKKVDDVKVKPLNHLDQDLMEKK